MSETTNDKNIPLTNTELVYNKDEFASLLRQVIGGTTLRSFASSSGVSIAHISRMLNNNLDNPPSPDTIKKLTRKGKILGTLDNTMYEKLMRAAGYIPSESEDSQDKSDKRNKFNALFEQTRLILTNAVYQNNNWECDIKKRVRRTDSSQADTASSKNELNFFFPDFLLEFHSGHIKKWYFEFIYFNGFTSMSNIIEYITSFFGKLTLQFPRCDVKYTLVIDDYDVLIRALKLKPIGLNANISFAVIDLEEKKFVTERYVKFCDGEDAETKNYLESTLLFQDDIETMLLLDEQR